MDKEALLKNLENPTNLFDGAQKGAEGDRQASLKKMTEQTKGAHPISAPSYKVLDKEISAEEKQNHFRSAGIFMEALAREAQEWKDCVGEGYAPAIIAILYGGVHINVNTLSQVSFDGIRIEGLMNGAPCAVLAHQSTVQMICHAVKLEPEVPVRRPIGFIWEGNEVEV